MVVHRSAAVTPGREGAVVESAVAGERSRGAAATEHACPPSVELRRRVRALAADLVASWKAGGLPASARTAQGLRHAAEQLVARGGGRSEHVGWAMVTIVSEYWRDRLAAGANGRRLLLLPDCPSAPPAGGAPGVPRVCGPACGIATIWAAARDGGWVVQSTDEAVAGIGALLTGQYDGILGVARLAHLEKAFAMLPAFSLPVAAVPCEPSGGPDAAGRAGGCAETLERLAIDVDWVLGLLGVAGGDSVPVADYLPLLRESAETFSASGLAALAARLGVEPAFGLTGRIEGGGPQSPLSATETMAGDFVVRGGKFLRPFVALAAFDAVRADLTEGADVNPARGYAVSEGVVRDAVKAAAVAIEVFHKASLVHDDIEDGDSVRYGRPTLHEAVGIPSAINAGDYLLGIGYRIVAGLPGVDPATLRDLVSILAAAHVRLARGQGAELWWRDAGDGRLAPAESLEMYGLKTSPAFEAAVALGVRLAGLEPAAAGPIQRYALHVGTGFQVLNDLKDWSGDLENDRRAAGDLLGGRPTLMWALALDRLSAPESAALRRLSAEAGAPGASDEVIARCIAEAREFYRRADVFARAAAIVARERQAAASAAAACRLPRLREVLEFLLDLAVPEQAAAHVGR